MNRFGDAHGARNLELSKHNLQFNSLKRNNITRTRASVKYDVLISRVIPALKSEAKIEREAGGIYIRKTEYTKSGKLPVELQNISDYYLNGRRQRDRLRPVEQNVRSESARVHARGQGGRIGGLDQWVGEWCRTRRHG